MTEGDKKAFDGEKAKAWEKQAGALSRSQNLKKHRKTFNRGYNAGFQAGRDSKGDGWCFDMDKAPRKGRFLAYGTRGEHITTWALCSPKKDMISPHSKPFAWMYLPQPPQDRKEG